MLNLLTCFKQQWRVTFLCPAKHTEFETSLDELGIDNAEIALNCSSFDEQLKLLAPDVVVFDRFMIEEQFGWRVTNTCPNALKILNTEDLHSLRDARHRAMKTESSELAFNTELCYREIASILRCDITLLLSKNEIQFLQQEFNIASELLHYWPLMPNPQQGLVSDEISRSFEQRSGFVFIGNYRHAPNWDAVLWLRQSIWPKVRALLPDAQLSVYGAYQPPKATQLHAPKQGFLIKGRAPSAAHVMLQARVCLAPLRFGAGIKGKLLDAIATQTPSVTTQIGIEGITSATNWPGNVAEDETAIAEAAVDLHENTNTWHAASTKCLSLFDQTQNAQPHTQQLTKVIENALTDISGRRKRNFYGAMLQHHTLSSTRYMTQWIEAKNSK